MPGYPRLRPVVPSLLLAAATAVFVGVLSILVDAPRVWPGVFFAFVWVAVVDYALSARRRRSAERRRQAVPAAHDDPDPAG